MRCLLGVKMGVRGIGRKVGKRVEGRPSALEKGNFWRNERESGEGNVWLLNNNNKGEARDELRTRDSPQLICGPDLTPTQGRE